MIPVGVIIAIIDGDTILLTLREDFEVWCLPGGEIDEGESIAEAARREVREETGLEVELTRLVGTYSQLGSYADHDILFAARIIGGTLMSDPREVLEARFFRFDALPEHLLVGAHEMLQDVLHRRCGVVKTERVSTPKLSRSELYAQRDQSGLSRREYYQRHFPQLTTERVTTEVAGVHVEL